MLRRWRARRKMRWAVQRVRLSHGEPRYREKVVRAIRTWRDAQRALEELEAHPSLEGPCG